MSYDNVLKMRVKISVKMDFSVARPDDKNINVRVLPQHSRMHGGHWTGNYGEELIRPRRSHAEMHVVLIKRQRVPDG